MRTPTAARYAVIGNPVAHSRSPAIHAAFAAQTGQRLAYGRLSAALDAFEATAGRFFAGGGAGLNVTLPFKVSAAAYADSLSARAARAGAVNTLIRGEDGRIHGDNTDGIGLLRDLTANLGVAVADARVLMVGAGGAVRGAVPVLLGQRPRLLTIANRSPDKARAIAQACADLGDVTACGLDEIAAGWDIVINAVSAGLGGQMPALPAHSVENARIAYDMIYADKATPFMRWAQTHGAGATRDGWGMLVEQAAESFYLWRGVHPQTGPVIHGLRPQAL